MGGLDEGSRALLEKMQPPEPCRAVLDLGCGWGAVGLIAARLLRPERLTMIDANARAVEMARRNAIRLGIGDCRLEIENQDRERHQASGGQDAGFQSAIRDPQSAIAPGLDVRLESDAESLSARDELGSYDLVLTNPPYATDFRVTERFIQVARFALRLGGRAFFVGKPNERLPARIDEVFGNHEIQSRRGYAVVSAVRRD
jgi:16S rRNA (guanine1207-N2)-methyltransferase